ncbi:MAG TPA: PH domain-containing protein [Actinomycetota bacterium]
MAFPSRMSEGEHQVLALRPHWLGVVAPLVITVLVLVGMAAALLSIPESWPSWVRWIVVGAFSLILLLWPLRRIGAWVTSEYVITNERVVHRQGWLTKRSVEIPIMGVADVVFSQSVLQRLVRVGDVVIESAGGLGFTRLASIPRADDVHRTLYDLIEDARVVTSNNHGPPGPLDQIERLARLRERGLLTPQEFEIHKQRLLKQL